MTSTFEYQLHEGSVTSPSWLPLRFPGQYADTESGFFENWNRYFDPLTGKYQANDLQLPSASASSIYRYAANNPLAFIDPSCLREFKPDELAAIKQAIERVDKVDGLKAMKMRLLWGEGLLEAFDRSEFNERYPGELKPNQSLDDVAGIAFSGRIFIKEFNSNGGLDSTLVHELYHHENTLCGSRS